MRRSILTFISTMALVLAIAPVASASSPTETFDFLVGSDFLCGLGIPNACPDVAAAPNGDTIEIAGGGSISVHPKSASGSGTWTHKNADGDILATGTWTADWLISFHSYGSGEAQELPSDFWGGQALIHVTLHVDGLTVPGVLTVDCALGKVPGGATEGSTLHVTQSPLVPHAINFNKSVSGVTLFINTTP